MCLLKLVNKENSLESHFIPSHLTKDAISDIWLCEIALKAFYHLNYALANEGMSPLMLVSGYRAYDYQKMLYDKKTNHFLACGLSEHEARGCAGKIIAMPGSSEHQLGLAMDVTSCDMKDLSDPLVGAFEDTKEGFWLSQNSAKYGFVLRYPKDKTEITQIAYEPWHYRYVGVYYAQAMKHLGMCLEEYARYASY